MSSILYYSNACTNSERLLQKISTTKAKDDMHFVCVDKRTRKPNGATYVILGNGQEILLPPSITRVPALLILNRGHHVLFGEEIDQHIEPQYTAQQQQQQQQQQAAVVATGEPEAFSLGGGAGFGVSSDQFSYLDQDSDSLSAKGDGGLRQLHHYASVDHMDTIQTPPDDYQPDTVGNVSLEQLQQQRNAELPK